MMDFIMNIDILIIKVLAGFSGVIAHKFFQGQPTYFEIKKDILKYFIYTLLTIVTINLLNIFDYNKYIIAARVAIPITYAFMWTIFNKNIVEIINCLYRKINHNTIFIENSIFSKSFEDGQDHFLIVYKDNKVISYGFLADWEENNNEVSFSLIPPSKDEEYINKGIKKSVIYSDKKNIHRRNRFY